MSGKYTSAFDDLLANNQKQMDDVLGDASRTFATPSRREIPATTAAPTVAPAMENAPVSKTCSTTISGTTNGVLFRLTV